MKIYPLRRAVMALALSVAALASTRLARAEEKAALRLAVGPFFAPIANEKLRQSSDLLPELLMAELSQGTKFQLVERQKVQAFCNELNLSASGLVARETVARVGRVLACDWLVSGSLVQNGGRIVVWTKIIDVRNGVVLDLDSSPYDPENLARVVTGMAKFISQAGSERKARQFLALGPFVNMNPRLSPDLEDWSTRLSAAIERHFHEAGFGISELAAVMPIFEERRLEAAGLMSHPEQRVQLQAAFWLIDGGWQWGTNAPGELRVGLRMQQVGGPVQMFWFYAPAGEATEKKLIETITQALAQAPVVSPELAGKAEAELLATRGLEQATRNSPFRVRNVSQRKGDGTAHVQQMEDQRKRSMENRAALIATYQRNLLLDPKNLETKTMLGYALLFDQDPAQRQRGKELLREVVATGDPKYTARAQRHLSNADSHAAHAAKQSTSLVPSTDRVGLEKAVAADPTNLQAKYELGALLMLSLKGIDRGRAATLLGEVMDKGPSELAEQARRQMPSWALEMYSRKKVAQAVATPAPAPAANP